MTEDKRFYLDENGINDREYEFSILGEDELVDIINDLNDENKQLKKQLQEFRVEKSNRINAFCVTNDEYSVVLLKENESYMVCNMINRLIKELRK